jgi:hypothetical protein
MNASIKRHAPSALLVLVAASVGACTTVVQQGPGAAVVAQLSLERFLEASNARDLDAMARLFGTESGPAWDTGGTLGCAFKKIGSWFGGSPCVQKHDVEVRMDAIAQILRHDDYRIVREEGVAGRMGRATRVYVDMIVGGQTLSEVPFVMVRSGRGQWLVEEIDLARIMAGPRRTGRPMW